MTIELPFEKAGQAVAMLYVGYGTFLLAGAFLAFHALLLLLLVLATRKGCPRFPRLILLVELPYGFCNPLVYLVILQRAGVPGYAFLTGVAWGLFLLVWGCRLWGGFDRVRGAAVTRRCVRGLLLLALLCIVAFFVKDVVESAILQGSVAILQGSVRFQWPPQRWLDSLWGLAFLASIGALYMIPGVLVLRQLRPTRTDQRWASGRWFFLLSKPVSVATGALLLVTVAISWYRPSTAAVEQMVLVHRPKIIDASERHQIDPRLTASILYVTRRDLSTPFAQELERAAMGAWLADLNNNFFLAEPLDVSVGLAQIKPLTALAALVVYTAARLPEPIQGSLVTDDLVWAAISGFDHPVSYKEYRGVPRLGRRWKLPPEAVQSLAPDPAFRGLVPKSRIVEELFDDRLSIEMCALILSLYAIQWETADPTWSIRQRPEILATLYQLGFEKSWPKANPRPNSFGERVRQVYEGAWMREHFGPGGCRGRRGR